MNDQGNHEIKFISPDSIQRYKLVKLLRQASDEMLSNPENDNLYSCVFDTAGDFGKYLESTAREIENNIDKELYKICSLFLPTSEWDE
jgi:hypothetical protein